MTGPDPIIPVVGRHEQASEGRFDRNKANQTDFFDENEHSAQGRFDRNEANAAKRDVDSEATADDRYSALVKINRKLRHTVVVLCVLVVVVGGGVVIKLDNQNQEAQKSRVAIQAIAEQNRVNGERVRDCVDPMGRCFKDGQARTAAAIKALNDYNRLGRACTATVIKAGITTEQALPLIDACIAAHTPKPAGAGR